MKVEAIEVRYVDGTTALVLPSAVFGDFATHNSLLNSRPLITRWSVTHIPTGQVVWIVLTLEDANRVAQYLDEKKVVPQDPQEAREWVKQHHTTLRAELEQVAHYWPLPI